MGRILEGILWGILREFCAAILVFASNLVQMEEAEAILAQPLEALPCALVEAVCSMSAPPSGSNAPAAEAAAAPLPAGTPQKRTAMQAEAEASNKKAQRPLERSDTDEARPLAPFLARPHRSSTPPSH